MNNTYPIRPERGFSIVELMIALLLGLILLGGVIQVFLSSRQTYNANEAMSRMQENGRFALEFIARSARLAGYTGPEFTSTKPLPLVKPGLPAPYPADFASCNDCTGGAGDRIAFMYQPPIDPAILPAQPNRFDCRGNAFSGNDRLIINSYYVSGGSLRCKTITQIAGGGWPLAGTDIELVEGVDRLEVLYGIDTAGDSRSANQYVSADRVTNWNRVRSIRVAVLANSVDQLNRTSEVPPYVLLDAAKYEVNGGAGDGRARQIFTTTIQLKNFE